MKKYVLKIGAVLLTAVMITLLFAACNTQPTVTDPTGTTPSTEATFPAGMLTETAVILGNHELNSDELTYYYIDAISSYQNEIYSMYYSYYGSYWYFMLGFDTTQALNKQIKDSETNKTWADYFVDAAIQTAQTIYALYDDAMANSFELSAEEQKGLEDALESLSAYATYYKFNSVEDYLHSVYGNSASEKAYKDYYTKTFIASLYYNRHKESLEYEYEDYRAFEKDKEYLYNNYSYVYYKVAVSDYLGEGTKDANGNTVWTDAEKAEALQKAEADKSTLLGAEIRDKESFDKAVQALEINKQATEGGKTTAEVKNYSYQNIYLTDEAKEWITQKDRKSGDLEVFPVYNTTDVEGDQTINSYYVVLFDECNTNEEKLVNIRHILAKFTGGTTDSSGNVTYSDAEKNAAKAEAEKLLQQYRDSIANETDPAKIEEIFGALANKESDDQGGQVTNGGLYEDVYLGKMVKPFEDWCFDESRKPGDVGLVETVYGWHVMFYSSTDELTYRDSRIKADMINEDMYNWNKELTDKVEVTVVTLEYMEMDLVLG